VTFDLGETLIKEYGSGEMALQKMIEKATLENCEAVLKRIAAVPTETEREIHLQRLAERLKVPKRKIEKDLKGFAEDARTGTNPKARTANFPGLVDLVMDEKGNVAFLVKNGNSLDVIHRNKSGEAYYLPPGREFLPFGIPRTSEVQRWHLEDSDSLLFQDLLGYFKRFSYLPDSLWLIVACKVLLTYLQDHPDIYYLPMLLFWAVPERGKSRTGKAFTYVAFRGIHLVDIREANLFRYSQDLKATLFFDLKDLWKKAERNSAEDILLMRYEKGAKVGRVLYPERGAHEDMVYFDVYGPTVMATNEPVHKILDTRCLTITMPNKPGEYDNPTPEVAQELRARITAWRARVMDSPLPEIDRVPCLTGRLWDISKPLLQVCKMVYPEGLEGLKDGLAQLAGQRLEERRESIEGQIVSVINDLSKESEDAFEWVIKTQKVLDELNCNRAEGKKLTPQYLGKRLKAMGLCTRHVHGYSEMVLTRNDFNTLLAQFGIIDPPTPPETLPNSTTHSNQRLSAPCAGRELVESEESNTKTLPSEGIGMKRFGSLVDSGREFLGERGRKIFEGEPVPVACLICKGTRFWRRRDGKKWVCEVCHPPVTSNNQIVWSDSLTNQVPIVVT